MCREKIINYNWQILNIGKKAKSLKWSSVFKGWTAIEIKVWQSIKERINFFKHITCLSDGNLL